MTNILLVEDEADLLEMCSLYLQEKGYSVITARDGSDAVERYSELQKYMNISCSSLINKSGRSKCSNPFLQYSNINQTCYITVQQQPIYTLFFRASGW